MAGHLLENTLYLLKLRKRENLGLLALHCFGIAILTEKGWVKEAAVCYGTSSVRRELCLSSL
jgi:hypothetical protein